MENTTDRNETNFGNVEFRAANEPYTEMAGTATGGIPNLNDNAMQPERAESDEKPSHLHRPSNRAARLSVIQELLTNVQVGSQAQLSDLLSERGIHVTQATLSRDLDEMNATKVRMKNGRIAYTLGAEPWEGQASATEHIDRQLSRGLSGLIASVATAKNLLVVHTPAGAAQYMASVIDRQPIDGILGTVAGDDTVLLICIDDDTAGDRAKWLLDVVSKRQTKITQE